MKRISFAFVLAASAALLLILGPARVSADAPAALDAEIKAANARWAEAYNRGDIETVASLYTDNARLLPEGSDPIEGRAAISRYLQELRTATWPDAVRFSNYEIHSDGQFAAEYSDVEILGKDGTVKVRSKQVLVFLKQQGQWKLHMDIWTNNTPPKPQAP
ncbi:MAG TPA: DUF4440 domain-containing protein [Prosthecobacter sp.]